MNAINILGEICLKVGNIPGTIISSVWFFVKSSFLKYWYIIIPGVIIWVFWEILTREEHSYNSDNGFTPVFNSFVGGGVFCLFQYLTYLILELFFGKGIDCVSLWLYSFYLIPFVSTGLFLHGIGFWPYWKIPFVNAKIDLFGRGLR